MKQEFVDRELNTYEAAPYFIELKYPYHFDRCMFKAHFVWQKVGEKYKILKSRCGLPNEAIDEEAFLNLKEQNTRLLVSIFEKEFDARQKLSESHIDELEEKLKRLKMDYKNHLEALESRLTKFKLLLENR